MKVLFIRHGETEANVKHRHQLPDEPLTAKGIKEMQELSEKLKVFKPTHIICSPYSRAQHSAEIIAHNLGIKSVTRDEFRELRRPVSVYGKRHAGLSSIIYMVRWFISGLIHTDDPKNGESYTAFQNRIERARSILESFPNDARIIVVSHAIFINFFVEHACQADKISLWRTIPQLLKILALKNSGYIQLTYSEKGDAQVCEWQLELNDIDKAAIEERKQAKQKKENQESKSEQ